MTSIKGILEQIALLFSNESRLSLKKRYGETNIAQPVIELIDDVINNMYSMEVFIDEQTQPVPSDIEHLYNSILDLFIIIHHRVVLMRETIDMSEVFDKLNLKYEDKDLTIPESRYAFVQKMIILICNQK